MKTKDFIEKYNPCRDGREFALQFETMSEVWQNCKRSDWLFWILEKHAPLEKEQSVRLAIAFAETCLIHVQEGEERPATAIQAAKNWLENPTEENRAAARAAADAARAAAYAAARAAYAAAYAARAAAYAAADAARAAAYAAADAAANAAYAAADAAANAANAARAARAARAAARAAGDAAQCDMIREVIKNPFE